VHSQRRAGQLKPFHFSIIIPTFERAKQLADCLESLARLEYPRERFEVIVVDDGGGVPLENVAASFCHRLNLQVLRQPNGGPASARNAGAMKAKGRFLAFTDDDCAPARNWLEVLAERFAANSDHMIGGRTVNALPDNLFTAGTQLMTDAVYAYYNDNPGRPHFFTSNNLAVPTERFRALGGFDTSFPLAASEDREFCERWLQQGYQMTYAPEAIVEHAHALTFHDFLRHHFNYGRGALHFHSVRARRGWQCLKIDPKFYVHLFGYPVSHEYGTRAFLFEALFMLSYVAYTGGFFWEKAHRAMADYHSSSGSTAIT
jgi:glycosyltransferase involved in cell wall biosynthesis